MSTGAPHRLDAAGLRERIRTRLAVLQPDVGDPRIAGISAEMARAFRHLAPSQPTPAAVLVPIIDYTTHLSVLLTQRAADLKNHAGQISFPGGRIEDEDGGPLAAALRETEEEIGLARAFVEIVGFMPDHILMSGYRVTPVVGFVRPGYALRLDTTEVTEVFEVPLEFLLDPANHKSRWRKLGGRDIEVFDIPYGERNIWGATAGILLSFFHLLRD